MQTKASSHFYQYPKTNGPQIQIAGGAERAENEGVSTSTDPSSPDTLKTQIKALQKYNISILNGEKKDDFATTSTHIICHFKPAANQHKELLFKFDTPLKSEKYEKTSVPGEINPASAEAYPYTPL